MCRLAAFPPGTERNEALAVLLNMERGNIDGTGSCYINADGKFVIRKWARSLSYCLKRDFPFLDHMPHKGWTIVHLRAASHGGNCKENTHPFLVGDSPNDPNWAICHNGIWNDYNIAKLALSKSVRFIGDTDSEVAAYMINILGPKKFTNEIDFGGVYLCLNKRGDLYALKTSGQLSIFQYKNKKVLLSSELTYKDYGRHVEAITGWYHFDKHGYYKECCKKEEFRFERKRGRKNWHNRHFGGNQYSSYVPSSVSRNLPIHYADSKVVSFGGGVSMIEHWD